MYRIIEDKGAENPDERFWVAGRDGIAIFAPWNGFRYREDADKKKRELESALKSPKGT